jgi:hypothetical protein
MLPADSAHVSWDTHKKQWNVRVKVGEEVMRRPIPGTPENASDEVLRSLALETAKADGYEVDPARIEIARPVTAL